MVTTKNSDLILVVQYYVCTVTPPLAVIRLVYITRAAGEEEIGQDDEEQYGKIIDRRIKVTALCPNERIRAHKVTVRADRSLSSPTNIVDRAPPLG